MSRNTLPADRLALVTGASQGLGRVLAHFLATQGYDLIIDARGRQALIETADELRSAGARVTAVAGDIGEADHRRQLVQAVSAGGGLHLLINNASTLGPLPMPALVDYPLDGLRRVLEVNSLAPLALVQDLLPALSTRQGLVVNMSSDAAGGGYESWGGYGASKAALDLISLTLANELRSEGVGVVSVDPGDMRTAMHQNAFAGEDISDRPGPEVTLPFWAWLLGQEPLAISGRRFQAQAEVWTEATAAAVGS